MKVLCRGANFNAEDQELLAAAGFTFEEETVMMPYGSPTTYAIAVLSGLDPRSRPPPASHLIHRKPGRHLDHALTSGDLDLGSLADDSDYQRYLHCLAEP